MIGRKTYEISKITSVSLGEKNLSPFAGKTLVFLSLISFLIGILSCLGALSNSLHQYSRRFRRPTSDYLAFSSCSYRADIYLCWVVRLGVR